MWTKTVLFGTKALTGVAICGQLLCFTNTANATAYAYSALEVTNFSLTNQFGGFNTFQFTSQPLSSTLNGNSISTGLLLSTVSGGTVNQHQLTQGSTGFAADNAYFGAHRPTLLSPTADWAVADSNMLNTQILAGHGQFGTQAGAQTSGGVAGAASTGTLNSLSWTFNVSAAELAAARGNINLAWSLGALSNVHIETTLPGETARATLGLTVNLFRGGSRLASTHYLDELMFLSADSDPGAAGDAGEVAQTFTGNFHITAVGNYTFNTLFDSSAQVSSVAVPEPAPLALLGLGLVGLGLVRRRKTA